MMCGRAQLPEKLRHAVARGCKVCKAWCSGGKWKKACWLTARSMPGHPRTNAISCTLAQRHMQRPHYSRPDRKKVACVR